MSHKERRIALYLRVSIGNQTVENQWESLQLVANRHGWQVVQVFTDEVISGAKGRNKSPGVKWIWWQRGAWIDLGDLYRAAPSWN